MPPPCAPSTGPFTSTLCGRCPTGCVPSPIARTTIPTSLTTLARIFASAGDAILVAEAGGALVGLVEVAVRADEAHPARIGRCFGYIGGLIVQAQARQQRVGSQLVTAAEAWARQRGVAEMRLDVWELAAKPLPFYARLGYRTLSHTLVKPLWPGVGAEDVGSDEIQT